MAKLASSWPSVNYKKYIKSYMNMAVILITLPEYPEYNPHSPQAQYCVKMTGVFEGKMGTKR